MRHIVAVLLLLLIPLRVLAQYRPDRLGEGFEYQTLHMPDDYSGEVVTTLIRYKNSIDTLHRAVLYVHGYNDYFFQKELAQTFTDSCYNFYAVDLRKYGRSLLPSQTPFEVRNLEEYFADIDTTLSIVRAEGNREVVLMGHSTGGLIASLYCEAHRDNLPVQGLILNSPFFDMNMSRFMADVLVPIVAKLGGFIKNAKIPQGNSTAYSESLLKQYHGEWEYDTNLKFRISPSVSLSWVRAIHQGHKQIQNGTRIPCPILLMYSSQSIYGNEWTPAHQLGDAVLNVEDIARYGRNLGADVTECEVPEGLHDLILSKPASRQFAYNAIFHWLRREGL